MKKRTNHWNILKCLFMLPLLALFSVAFTACDKDDDSPRKGSSNVMAVHASPDAAAVVFYLDKSKISAAAIGYGEITNYVSTTDGKRKAEFRGAQDNALLATAELDLTEKKNYTVFFAGPVAAADVVAVEDDLAAPAQGKAKVRFINLSPDDTNLDIKVREGNTLATGRVYKSVSNFLEVDPGAVKYEVLNSQDNSLVFTMPDFTLEVGKIYTIWIKGSKNGVGDAELGAKIIVHNK